MFCRLIYFAKQSYKSEFIYRPYLIEGYLALLPVEKGANPGRVTAICGSKRSNYYGADGAVLTIGATQ